MIDIKRLQQIYYILTTKQLLKEFLEKTFPTISENLIIQNNNNKILITTPQTQIIINLEEPIISLPITSPNYHLLLETLTTKNEQQILKNLNYLPSKIRNLIKNILITE